MRVLLVLALILVGYAGFGTSSARAALVCPTTVNTNTDCGFIITIGPGNTLTGAAVAGANPYDGDDDALIGVVNNSGSVYTGSFTLTGSGNGGGLFGFDGDGICYYTGAAYCSKAATGYEGPLNTFTNINAAQTSGTVSFSTLGGIPVGGTSFFSLESSPASIAAGGGIGGLGGGGGGTTTTTTTSTPEPGTSGMLLAGLASVWLFRRRAAR